MVLGVSPMSHEEKYLGLPTLVVRKKYDVFAYIKEKV